MAKYSTVVIGGGAAGICAAISTARRGESVLICEKLAQLGKKLLATGDGRCNLLNADLSENYYNAAARPLVKSVFARSGKSEILDFFHDLGLQVYTKDGRIFPVTNQAASVLKVLEMELRRLSVYAEFGFACTGISITKKGIVVSSADGKRIECCKVIVTGGGKSYPKFGSDGGIYAIAQTLGHTIVEPVPSVVPLVVNDSLCRLLEGMRITAGARSVAGGREGAKVQGELLFTRYGLSGTCILDVSEPISIALNREHKTDVSVSVDMVPFMDADALRRELARRKKARWSPEEMLVGILPNRIAIALKSLFEKNDLDAVISALKDRRFKVDATRGWNEAEFTAGGINVNEIDARTLGSRIAKGVYFAGEVLDVNGRRGGYNLAWAWASGFVAGQAPLSF